MDLGFPFAVIVRKLRLGFCFAIHFRNGWSDSASRSE